jgi:hypothetical protein
VPRQASFELDVRTALGHLHDLPYLQTHPLGGDRGKELQRRLSEGLDALGGGRRAELLRLRYAEALESAEVARRLGISIGEYYREHAQGIAALASLLADADTAGDAGRRPGDPSGLSALPEPPRPSAAAACLPRQLTSFVGRERDVAEVAALVASSPLVTLAGPGGVGKTRLALAVAERAAHPASGGAWLVELAALADEALVPTAIAAALGVSVRSDPLGALARWLDGRPALLLLDNWSENASRSDFRSARLAG